MALARVAWVASACFASIVDANAFLGVHPNNNNRLVMVQEVEDLLSLGLASEKTSAEIKRIEEVLGPLFATLPKNENGRLEPPVVRYALHRYFAHQYGWHLNGLAQAGDSWNSSSPSSIMNGQVPSYIESLIEKRLGHGLGLEEVAVFAATMTDFINKGVVHDDMHVYDVRGAATTSSVTSEEFETFVKMTLVARIYGVEGGDTQADYDKSENYLIENYWEWDSVKMWATDLQQTYGNFLQARNPFREGYDIKYAVGFMQELSLKHGHLQAMDCKSHKYQLMDLEHEGTGRVPLSQFYRGAHEGDDNWPFIEKQGYLRLLGALDESNPSQPKVIIPNYLNGLSNCITPSAFYSVCCVNECEGLLSHVERAVAAPEGDPARIAEVVSNLGSDTVDAPRNLSTSQMAHLFEIAERNGGRVPLHGRLFAQFMHHAFPRECVFPHVSGTTSPEVPDDWEQRTGSDIYADDDEIRRHVVESKLLDKASLQDDVDALPWTEVEELVGSHKFRSSPSEGLQSSRLLRVVLLLVAVSSALWPVVRSSKVASGYSPGGQLEKHYV